jgi:hypothetical protein
VLFGNLILMNTRSGSWWEASLPRQRRALKPSLARIHEQGDLLNQINVILPDGQSLLIFRTRVKPPLQKYFPSRPTQINSMISPSRPERGALRTSSTRGGMRWTRQRQAMSGDGRAGRPELLGAAPCHFRHGFGLLTRCIIAGPFAWLAGCIDPTL